MTTWDFVLGILSGTAALLTVASSYVLLSNFLKWYYAPRFVVGVLPSPEESSTALAARQELFRVSPLDECLFLRKKLEGRRRFPLMRGKLQLPIIIQNVGRREAAVYKLAISFDEPNVRVVNVRTETLKVDGLYVHEPDVLEDAELTKRVPHASIRQQYQTLGLTGDYVSLTGSLAARAFEMVMLTLSPPSDLCQFRVNFRIDFPEGFRKRQTSVQPIIFNSPPK